MSPSMVSVVKKPIALAPFCVQIVFITSSETLHPEIPPTEVMGSGVLSGEGASSDQHQERVPDGQMAPDHMCQSQKGWGGISW